MLHPPASHVHSVVGLIVALTQPVAARYFSRFDSAPFRETH